MLNDPNAIIDRLLQGAGLNKDRQLAQELGVSPQAISQARRKGKIPDRWILQLASRYQLSPEWIFNGQGQAKGAASLPGSIPSRPVNFHSPLSARANQQEASSFPAKLEAAPQISVPEMSLIPLVEASLAAGSGSLQTGAQVQGYFAFRQDWLLRKGNPEQMVLMKVFGDSMEPEIRQGDMVLVDQAHTQLLGHAIYAVGVNEEIYIKQVESRPGNRLLLRSFNKRYEPIEVSLHGDLADSVRIIGRVIWWCREA